MAEFSKEWKSLVPVSSVFSPPSLISSPSLGPLLFTPSRKTSAITIPSLQKLFHYTSGDTSTTHTLLPIVASSSSQSQFFLFFPTQSSHHHLACLHFSLDQNNNFVFISEETMEYQLQTQITGIYPSLLPTSKITVCVSTASSIHWFIKHITSSLTSSYQDTHHFDHPIQHACWSPHVASSFLVLLQNGDLFLFHCDENQVFKSSIPWNSQHKNNDTNTWLACAFTFHPHRFIVASSHAIMLINGSQVCVVAESGTDNFVAFCMAGSTGYHFVVASHKSLYLFDTQNPREPMLQWCHHLNNPQYLKVFRLSDLRSMENEYKWATCSGFAIVLGSLLTSAFSLFCYGPSFPPTQDNLFKAWGLPSEISMLGNHWKCDCRDCLVKHNFSETTLPEWRKQRVWGFCVGSRTLENDGFTLVRLVSSGELEAQEFVASYNKLTKGCSNKESSMGEGSVVDLFICKEYEFDRKFKYLCLDSLDGFIKGDLSRVVESKSKKLIAQSSSTYTRKSLKYSSGGIMNSVEDILKDISWPMSIQEMGSRRTWGMLGEDIMKLAFIPKSKLSGVAINHMNPSLEAPNMSKKPTSQSSKRSCKSKQELSDELVGPVLPLHYLLTLQQGPSKQYSSNQLMSLSSSQIVDAISIKKKMESPLLLFHKPGAAFTDAEDDTLMISKIRDPKGNKETGIDMFDDTCPIALEYECPSLDFSSQETAAYRILKANTIAWQQNNVPLLEFTANCKDN